MVIQCSSTTLVGSDFMKSSFFLAGHEKFKIAVKLRHSSFLCFFDFTLNYGTAVTMMVRMGWHFGQGLRVASLLADNAQTGYSEMLHTLTVTMASRTLELQQRIQCLEDGVYTPVVFIRSADNEPYASLTPASMERSFESAGC